MRFEELRKQMRAISQGQKIQEPDKARSIVTQMIEIGFAEPASRGQVADIFAFWCETAYPEQMPHLLQTVWDAKETEVVTRRQRQEQRAKMVVTRKKELNQDIERLILIVAIQRLLADSRLIATRQMEQVRHEAEAIQEKVKQLETTLQERVAHLKGNIS